MKSKPLFPRFFKSTPVTTKFTSSQIDAEKGVLRKVVMCQVGEAKGHGMHLEQDFIDEIIAYDKANYDKTGIKARFGHPSFSDTTMGTQMGVFRNFQVDGDKAVADLHLLDAANLSPKYPKMRDWMLKMAEERPDFVMSSIVFRAGAYYQRTQKGKKRYCWCYVEKENEDGEKEEVWQRPNRKLGKIFVELGSEGAHFYTDLVESGAATDNLFSNQFNQDKFAIQAVEFVKEHPKMLTFLKENPGKIVEFTQKLGIEIPKTTFSVDDKMDAIKKLFGNPEGYVNSELKTVQEKVTALQKQLKKAQEDHETALKAEKDKVTKLTAENEKLRKRVPDPTKLDPGNKGGNQPVKQHPFTQKAIKMFPHLAKK